MDDVVKAADSMLEWPIVVSLLKMMDEPNIKASSFEIQID